ncbi:biliverdin-producing heme oxygenase [Jiangella alkaliphila]|uniref:Heme oxygenase n=1 Tax=Jiangella alkaliphila TaxID=419479 RepID=A0A1H2GPP7_9ACTN|nr:biliverdin-producing heme oxygenase [Jiangella alkaliphila]SDU21567.1 heme oxygenase [Jiangella alkaliphila]
MPTTRTPADAEPRTFSQALRERSWPLHDVANGADFINALMEGRMSRAGYTALVTQHLFVYEALESVAAGMRDDPIAGPFVTDELERVPSLRADLAHLLGGADAVDDLEPLPATRRYADRIRETAQWPGGFVAHHYTRYLGDLSGGLAVGTLVARAYGLELGGDGVRFYHFAQIPKPRPFKDAYRARLDAAPWNPDERERVIDEVVAAYGMNTEIFVELGAVHAATPAAG